MIRRALTASRVTVLSLLATSHALMAQEGRRYISPRTVADTALTPFSGGVLVGNTLYLSGKIGLTEDRKVPTTATEEARLVLNDVKATLEAVGMTMDDLVSVQVFCSDVSHYDAFNRVYRTYFTKEFPARAFLGAGTLLYGARFEVQAIASNLRAQVHPDEAEIRLARAGSNRAIARHDVPGIVAFLAEEYRVATSNGSFYQSPAEMGSAFTARFDEFKDAVYVRTPESVAVHTSGVVASETGSWTGSWTTPGGPFRNGGRYAAYWRKVADKWLIHSELFVPLF